MTVLILVSMAILFGFIGLGVKRFGLLHSYSAYSARWTEALPLGGLHPWSLVTFSAAFLMIPPMIEAGDGNALQFLGFFAPLYLIVVSLTPEWEANATQQKVHVYGASACAVLAFLWIVMVCHMWYVVLPMGLLVFGCAACSQRYDAYVFWGEMVMFLSTYVTLLVI